MNLRKAFFLMVGGAALIILIGATTSMIDYRTGLRSVPILTDAGQASLDAACKSASGASLAVTQKWTVPTMTCPANLVFTGGTIQPASGQKVTLSGSITADLSQHFDTSLAGPGSILITGKVASIYPNWFGAKMNGSTDDTAAWQAAIASVLGSDQRGGTIAMPANVTSVTKAGIVVTLNNKYIRIVGQGNSSVIRCTGVACVTWTGADAEGSGMSDLLISDPVGNSATIGLYLNGVSLSNVNSNMRFSNMRILGNSNLQSGGRFAGLGIGVKLNYTVLARFDNVEVQYFNTDVLDAPGFNSSMWSQSYMYGAGDKGWDIEAPGDMWAIQTDFESNRNTGIYMATGAGSVSVMQSHFEDNPNQFEVVVGQLTSSANNYEGGNGLIDSGSSAAFVSTGMDNFNGATTITNNSVGGSSGLIGATIENPLYGPVLAGTGCTISTTKGTKTASAGCSGLGYPSAGFTTYSVDQQLQTPGLATTGKAATLNEGSACGSPIPIVTGTATAGSFAAGSGITSCTAKINLPVSAGPNHAWVCYGSDITAGTPMPEFTGGGINSCVIKGTVTARDVITFFAVAL